jgi:hypothetical protein
MSPERERRPAMNDSERAHLLNRIAELEWANRRWKLLALAGTPLLGILLVMMTAFGTASYLQLRDSVRREQHAFDLSRAAVDEVLSRVEQDRQAEPSRQAAEQFLEQARRFAEQRDDEAGARVGAKEEEKENTAPKP